MAPIIENIIEIDSIATSVNITKFFSLILISFIYMKKEIVIINVANKNLNN